MRTINTQYLSKQNLGTDLYYPASQNIRPILKITWQDILKVMKENNLQLRLLYPARISFKYEGENQKLYRQAKAERIQHHQTSSPTNAKGYSLDRKHKKGV